jgi:DNA ligase D-like protein (predicted ligase)
MSSEETPFIESMECLSVAQIPEGKEWTYEIKFDGYRLEAVKGRSAVTLYSRQGKDLTRQFPSIALALKDLPAMTVLDGEVVALDEAGRSDFGLLQNYRSAEARIHYYVFDALLHKGKDLTARPLEARRAILPKVTPQNNQVSLSPVERGSASEILGFVRQHALEGVIAKRADSIYEPGKRSGLWTKTRIITGQEFVVGGYTPGGNGLDALIVGYYKGRELLYAARVRAGFVAATRRQVFARLRGLEIPKCPFANLPEVSEGRWGEGFTADKMSGSVWVRPTVVVRIDFRQWTAAGHLRHTKFGAIRDDKDPQKVVRET